ncbi:protein phosphatase 2C domain-containing protein [Bacillus sp. T33-2]|uniref:protein phosphatase 2C domain-containing protein n=1 Tax=Bacillus sp. T33-2 TaxID=2054168 RepID=UPI000C77D1C4|nr:protein phosphatase 2C domain-containing protein [Bacillus sp. T33-2]PLR89086.1 protein phosphatase [Bacillus sp. T33-2]
MNKSIKAFSWVGSQENFVDQLNVHQINRIMVGRYGGSSTAGQYKNEDGCLVWQDEKEEWELAIILDAHHTAESAELVLEQFLNRKTDITRLLSRPVVYSFKRLEEMVLKLFQGEDFLTACRNVRGETACLIVARKDKYLWWFSVGDCILYLFHEELAALGQYQVNQRQFYEWLGQVNTFEQSVPCYTSGTKELRKGINHIFLTTDGLVECPNEPFLDPSEIFKVLSDSPGDKNILPLLQTLKQNDARDSTTIVAWDVSISKDASRPSDE